MPRRPKEVVRHPSSTASKKSSGIRKLFDSLERRRLLCGDHPWHASEDGGVTMDAEGNIVDLSLSPNTSTGRAGADFNVTTGWGSSVVSYSFSNLLDGGLPLASGTTTSDLRQMIYDALGLWTAVSGLTLTYQNDSGPAVNDTVYNGSGHPQIRIGHHDITESNPPLNTLAHCYYPGGNGRDGDMHFDNTDTWGNGTGGGINFLETATHELGHGIGIMHANGDASGSCPVAKPAIMDACIQNRFTDRNSAYLFADDIAAVQSLYGNSLGYIRGQDGVARVYGTGVASNVNGINVITVTTTNIPIVGDCYRVTSDGYGSTLIPTSSINGLIIEGMGGNDFLRVDNNFVGKPITLRGGNGDDYFDFGYNSRALGAIPQGVSVEGGAGTDRIWTYDDNTTVAQTYTITSARFDRGGWGGFFYDAAIEGLFMQTGQGADVVNIQSTYVGQPVTLNSKGGADTVNIGNASNGVQSISADVQLNNSPSFTTININNGADTGNRNWLVNDVNSSYGSIYGLAPAGIVWNNTDTDIINITTGSGVDTGSIARLSETMNINNATANPGGVYDNITIGNSSAGGLASIVQGRSGGLTIDNNPSYTALVINDTGNNVARNATLDIVASYNQLTNLAPAVIRWDDGDTYTTEIRTGGAADTLNVARYHASGGLVLNSAGDQDTVNLGNNTDGVRSLTASVIVRNSPSYTTLNINGNFDNVARSMIIDYDPVGDLESLAGMAPANLYWDPGDIWPSAGVSITTGSGADSIAVLANERTLNLATVGTPGENVSFGPNLDRINADVYVRNAVNTTAVTVNDIAFAGGRAMDLGTATVGSEFFSRVTGFGASLYLKAVDIVNPFVVNTGAGNDTVMVSATANNLTLNTGNGDDRVLVGSGVTNNMDPVNANVAVDGGIGSDYIHFTDQNYASAGGNMNVNATNVTTNHSAPVGYANVELLDFYLSNAGSTLNVLNATTSVYATGGTSHDTFNIYNNPVYTFLSASGGRDDVTVDVLDNGAGGIVLLNGPAHDLGSLFMGNGARVQSSGATDATIRVTSLTAAGGSLDLKTGSLIVNYAGATPMSTIRSALLSARNGGAWNGPGITSTNITPGYALGYAEATQIRTSFPATFGAFADVDNTSIIVRYTRLGDANLDKAVNFDDLLIEAQNYNPAVSGRIWAQGDFDYNGFTNFDDLLLIAQQYGNSALSADWARATASTSPKRRAVMASVTEDALI